MGDDLLGPDNVLRDVHYRLTAGQGTAAGTDRVGCYENTAFTLNRRHVDTETVVTDTQRQ